MKIALLTVGTRGDVQPFVVLGRKLTSRGHDVTLATHTDYEAWIRASGLGFAPVGGSFKALIESPEGRDWIESADSLRRYTQTTKRVFVPLMDAWARDLVGVAQNADGVVAHPYAVVGTYVAERRGKPAVITPFFPWMPSSRFVEPIFMPRLAAIGWLRRAFSELAAKSVWALAMETHQRLRAQLGLAPFRTKNPWNELLGARLPVVNLFSAALTGHPADWPEWAHVAGFVFDDAPADYTPPPALESFLAAGAPPVYIGFGSMTGRDPAELSRIALDAIARTGQRAVLASGWGGVSADALPSNVFPLGEVPHAWLFPRVAAVVHHGGAGTTAAGLRAGRPTLVTAFFGDQPYFGTRVAKVGAGPEPILRGRLDVAQLSRGIDAIVSNSEYRSGAGAIGAKLRSEDGAARAADLIEEHFGARAPRA